MHTHITAQDNDKNIYFIGLEFLSFNIISYQDILLNKIIVAITLHCCLQCLRQNFARTDCPAHDIKEGGGDSTLVLNTLLYLKVILQYSILVQENLIFSLNVKGVKSFSK